MPNDRNRNNSVAYTTALVFLIVANTLLASGQTAVTTYHNDNRRTGWNNKETTLTPANVWSPNFGLLHTIALNDQVDAQPLVVPGVMITAGNFKGTHDVAYVATESNTVYAIDVHSGTVLLSPNFGAPVPKASLPGSCGNNGPNVGINSTPVIDQTSNTLYVMVYTNDGPTYRLHALDLGSLADKVTLQVVSASHTLTNGTTFTFNAKYQRQRPALLLANGSIYAGFGSFCDKSANLSRGWLLGWTAGTLAPFPHNELVDTQVSDPNNFFLSSIWMSGYGAAADDSGNVLFVTGNSDPSGTTYDGVTNIQESVVKVSSTITSVVDLFTPDNVSSLDKGDTDFGSGGALVLPDQPGSIPHMAVAAGKDGNMYFMNEDHLGGFSPTTNNVLGTYGVGACWCGQSYYVDPVDGFGRVVSSGGNGLGVWTVQTSPKAALLETGSAIVAPTGQDGGFFTSVSSNGTANPIIWAVSRPINVSLFAVNLFAFDPDSFTAPLLSIGAGTWPNLGGNSNLVPVVANGQVYVASNQQLQIFGVTGTNLRVEKTAGTAANVTCAFPSTSSTFWSPLSAVSFQGAGATASMFVTPKAATDTQCLYVTGFQFSIPTNATILGIAASFMGDITSNGQPPVGFAVHLLKAGSPTTTVVDINPILNSPARQFTAGSSNYLWGTTWTPNDINQSNFGVELQATIQENVGGSGATANLGQVQLTVYYTP